MHTTDSPLANFNPRSLTGATWLHNVQRRHSYHFNPRSLTGATPDCISSTNNRVYFNPRSLTGATLRFLRRGTAWFHFNPRSLTGATKRNNGRHEERQFQSTLPHGSDLVKVTRLLFYISISIHAPSRERLFSSVAAAAVWHFNPRSLTGATPAGGKSSNKI